MNMIVAIGSMSQRRMRAMKMPSARRKRLIAIGRYIIFITTPNMYPNMVLSLCHGTKKFLKRREIERLSSRIVEILTKILRYFIGIFIYHQLRKSWM